MPFRSVVKLGWYHRTGTFKPSFLEAFKTTSGYGMPFQWFSKAQRPSRRFLWKYSSLVKVAHLYPLWLKTHDCSMFFLWFFAWFSNLLLITPPLSTISVCHLLRVAQCCQVAARGRCCSKEFRRSFKASNLKWAVRQVKKTDPPKKKKQHRQFGSISRIEKNR